MEWVGSTNRKVWGVSGQRPDDGQVQGPKHVVLVINNPLPY